VSRMLSPLVWTTLDNPQTCRVQMEATTLAACEPAIAATVRAAGAVTRDQLTGMFPGRRC
jgi:hypothetical protein